MHGVEAPQHRGQNCNERVFAGSVRCKRRRLQVRERREDDRRRPGSMACENGGVAW